MATKVDDGVRIDLTIKNLKMQKAKLVLKLISKEPDVIVRENGGNGGE